MDGDVDGEGVKVKVRGPVLSRMLLHKLRCGDVDGMTLVQPCSADSAVSNASNVSTVSTVWRPVSEVRYIYSSLHYID